MVLLKARRAGAGLFELSDGQAQDHYYRQLSYSLFLLVHLNTHKQDRQTHTFSYSHNTYDIGSFLVRGGGGP